LLLTTTSRRRPCPAPALGEPAALERLHPTNARPASAPAISSPEIGIFPSSLRSVYEASLPDSEEVSAAAERSSPRRLSQARICRQVRLRMRSIVRPWSAQRSVTCSVPTHQVDQIFNRIALLPERAGLRRDAVSEPAGIVQRAVF